MSTEIQLTPELAGQQTALELRVNAIVVTNDEERTDAENTIRDIKAVRKAIESFFEPFASRAHATWKAITTARGDATKPLDAMEAAVKAKILPYATAKAERERQAREEEQARLREQEAAAREQAEAAVMFGETTEAAALEVQAHVLKHQAAAIVPGKPTGTRDNWKWRVVDDAKIPRGYLTPDATLLDSVAKTKKGDAKVDGIEFYNEPIVVVR